MEKTEQQQINDLTEEAIVEISKALKAGDKLVLSLMKLLQFEGNRIDALENKIDLLMTERAEAIVDRNPDLFKDE